MAVTNEQVFNWLQANPNATDAQIAQAAAAAGVSAQQLSAVTGVPVAQIEARVAAAAPTVQLPPAAPAPTLFSAPAVASAPSVATTPASAATANTWNYDEYVKALKTGGNLNEQVQRLATQDPNLAAAASNLFGEITAQQQAGTSDFWYQGNTASKEAAAADFALRLAENGITSLSQLGQVTIPGDGENLMDQQVIINKATGQPLPRPELLGRGTRGLDIDYNLAFAADGTAIPFTSNRESSWMQFRENALKPAAAFALSTIGAPLIGATVAPSLSLATQGAIGGAIAGAGSAALTDGNVLQGALLGGVGGYLQGSSSVPNTAGYYDEITGQFIYDTNGLLPGPLSELSGTNIGSMSGYSYDPATQTWTLPDGTQVTSITGVTNNTVTGADLLGGTGVGGVLGAGTGTVAGSGTGTGVGTGTNVGTSTGTGVGTGTEITTGVGPNIATGTSTGLGGFGGGGGGSVFNTGLSFLTSQQIASLLRGGLGLLGAGAAVNAIGGSTGVPLQAPTQGVPANTPEYYQQLQQYYNAYMPQTPRDVVSPLQQWYNSSFGA